MRLTRALVLETENLTGGDEAQLETSLERLLRHLAPQLGAVDELVVTHEGPLDAGRLELAAGRRVTLVQVADGTGYYASKNRGFESTTADVVAFGDADCWPESDWLERLCAPFADASVRAVAGRTTYRRDLWGTAASTIDFNYYPSPLGPGCTRNFYANNVAFRREVFEAHAYGVEEMYRGHCQVLGLRLQEARVPIRFEPRARTIHRFPDDLRELALLRVRRGQDAAFLAPHLARAYLPPGLRFLVGPAAVLAARFATSVLAVNRQDMPPVRGLRRLGCVAAIAGISIVDATGAFAGAMGLSAGRGALGYHADPDSLDARAAAPS